MRHTVKRLFKSRVKRRAQTQKQSADAGTLPERFYRAFETPQHKIEEPGLATLPERFYYATDPLEESVAHDVARRRRLSALFKRNRR